MEHRTYTEHGFWEALFVVQGRVSGQCDSPLHFIVLRFDILREDWACSSVSRQIGPFLITVASVELVIEAMSLHVVLVNGPSQALAFLVQRQYRLMWQRLHVAPRTEHQGNSSKERKLRAHSVFAAIKTCLQHFARKPFTHFFHQNHNLSHGLAVTAKDITFGILGFWWTFGLPDKDTTLSTSPL